MRLIASTKLIASVKVASSKPLITLVAATLKLLPSSCHPKQSSLIRKTSTLSFRVSFKGEFEQQLLQGTPPVGFRAWSCWTILWLQYSWRTVRALSIVIGS
jgi:hypothetical protein